MVRRSGLIASCMLALMSVASHPAEWWDTNWRYRTSVSRPAPSRATGTHPVEVAIDFPLLMHEAGVRGALDPSTIRVVDPRTNRAVACEARPYVTWIADAAADRYDIYFETEGRSMEPPPVTGNLPPGNVLGNAGFESEADGWALLSPEAVSFERFAHTTGEGSLCVRVGDDTPPDVDRDIEISRRVDVAAYAGVGVLFECDMLAETAPYGAPASVQLIQYRADGSRIDHFVIQPRWTTVELAQGQLVQFSQRGRLSPEAASVDVRIRFRCQVRDADSGAAVDGPEGEFVVWLDRVVLRPGDEWPWPGRTHAGYVEGALADAPLNRAFEFTGQRRVCFNGASEASRTLAQHRLPETVHWGLQRGTVELWCRPAWDSTDGTDHVLYYGRAYMHRPQCWLRKLAGDESDALEFMIRDSAERYHRVRAETPLAAGQWHHIAATYDLPEARLQLFVDGTRVAVEAPGNGPWPSALKSTDDIDAKGIGISGSDKRTMPMQAYIGGDATWSAAGSAEAEIDEFRISDSVRYDGDFAPPQSEFALDAATRALFHFEHQKHGVHGGDDGFVRGYLSCELPPIAESVGLETRRGGEIRSREVVVRPHATEADFERNRAENRMTVTRPFRELPDPRFVERRARSVERVVDASREGFALKVGGDYEPQMRGVTFEATGEEPTLIPRWRANDSVVPFSVRDLKATLAPDAEADVEKAVEVMTYALKATNYYDASYCETLPTRHRPRVSYTLIKALNIYPFDQCGPLNHTLRKLFLAAGISSNNASGTHHQIEQAFFDGSHRVFDLSSRIFWLNRDCESLIGIQDIEDDPYLKLRQGGDCNAWLPGRPSHATFGSAERPHGMDLTLRPGERLSLTWHNEGRWFELTGDREPVPLAEIPPYFGNGAIVFTPERPCEGVEFTNLALPDNGQLTPRDAAQPASLTYHAACPYILSAASVTGRSSGDVGLSISTDQGETWTEVQRADAGRIDVDLTDEVSARYGYALRLGLAPGAAVTGFQVRSVVVVSPLSLPGALTRGANEIAFVGGPPAEPVRTRCHWIERHRSDLGVALNTLGFYHDDGDARRNVLIVPPDGEASLVTTLFGCKASARVWVDDLPEGWTCEPESVGIETRGDRASASLAIHAASDGQSGWFTLVVDEAGRERRVSIQAIVAECPLVTEAESGAVAGDAVRAEAPQQSGAASVRFAGEGTVHTSLAPTTEGPHALWMRARWDEGSRKELDITLNGESRTVTPVGMIGFSDWTDPRRAHTKMFAHYGEQYAHWAWYRVPDLTMTANSTSLDIRAQAGAEIDALVVLPIDPAIDRVAMDLFLNWNYAPWEAPQ